MKQVKEAFRDTLKTSGHLAHFLTQKQAGKSQPPLRQSYKKVSSSTVSIVGNSSNHSEKEPIPSNHASQLRQVNNSQEFEVTRHLK